MKEVECIFGFIALLIAAEDERILLSAISPCMQFSASAIPRSRPDGEWMLAKR